MNRKEFLYGLGAAAVASQADAKTKAAPAKAPRAIAMWDFSWLERRWPGAGYEDWDKALDELAERGYNAVRIDAYPHLVAVDPTREWTLLPPWNTQVWGSPDINRVRVFPALPDFMTKCRARGIKVAFSTWYREDEDKTRLKIGGPESLAANWIRTLDLIKAAGLIDTLLYVDLCNEWPLDVWAPWFQNEAPGGADWKTPKSMHYMSKALDAVRAAYPELPLLFSFCNERTEDYLENPLPQFDLFEQHVWMVQQNGGEFYREVGYNYERFDPKGYTAMSLKAEAAFRARPAYWTGLLDKRIASLADTSRQVKKPLITTECWAVVDYKDWPLLKWDWVKDLTADGVRQASKSGRWLAIATSNFCGPQFAGMWRDVEWHKQLTHLIRTGPIGDDLKTGRLWNAL